MYRVLYCLQAQHDWRLVALAALVCVIACSVAVLLIRRAQATSGTTRLRWALTAGAATRFGIWATHFIAMLAFDSGHAATYDLRLTLLSLFCAMAVTAGGIEIAVSNGFRLARLTGGAVIGSGVCSMHFIGMMALDLPGHIIWDLPLVVASLVFGIAFAAAAMGALELKSSWASPLAALLLVLAIVSHHFTAMGAVTILPDSHIAVTGVNITPASMSAILALAAIAVFSLCVFAVLSDRRLDHVRADSDRRFRILLEGIEDCAIFMLDAEGRIVDWNAGGDRINGYRTEDIVGQVYGDICAVDRDFPRQYREALAIAERDGRAELEGPGKRADGQTFWGHTLLRALRDNDGKLLGFANITQEITARKAAEDRMREVSRNFEAALSNMSQGLCLFDRNERLILANSRFSELYDLNSDIVRPGASFRDLLIAAKTRLDGRAPDDDTIEAMHARHRALIAHPDGGVLVSDIVANRAMSVSHRPMADGGWVSTFDDITERRNSEARIAHMTRHDGLTGLPNRLHFNDYLDEELAWAGRQSQRVAVVAIDLDRFKDINDQRGHAVGDAVLKAVAGRLNAIRGKTEFIASFGGDEFAALLRYDTPQDLHDFMVRVRECFTLPLAIDDAEIVPHGSIGVALYPQDGPTREALLNNAGLALYRAKTSIGDKACYFDASMDEIARDRRAMAKDLLLALEHDEFRVFYQVQTAVATREITGYEALIRWKHPSRGFVSPMDFISVAEESGAIIAIGAWVLRTACAEAARWENNLKIAVNLSPVQLNDTNLIDTVRGVLIETGLDPRRLELEITESTIIDDKQRALHILRQIKALGVTIALDDFGTGYASLDTLNAFPFDKIKIDRSFLVEINGNDGSKSQQSRAIVRAVIALGKSLSIPVLAEGVETESHMSLLLEEGCEGAQGYLLGRPVEHIPSPLRLAAG